MMRTIEVSSCRDCPFCRHNFTCGFPRNDNLLVMPSVICQMDRVPKSCPLPLAVIKEETENE